VSSQALSGYAFTPRKPIHGSTEATRYSDMAETPLELGLRAGDNRLHDAYQDNKFFLSWGTQEEVTNGHLR
jgi:hypothetical protein